jgi:hypothetical protein
MAFCFTFLASGFGKPFQIINARGTFPALQCIILANIYFLNFKER